MHKALNISIMSNSAILSLWGRGVAQRGLGPLAGRSDAASGFLSFPLLASLSVFSELFSPFDFLPGAPLLLILFILFILDIECLMSCHFFLREC